MQHKQHRTRQGEKRDFYLFSPSSPGISKPWPLALCAQRLKAEGAECRAQAGARGPGPGDGAQVWPCCDGDIALPRAARPAGPGAQSTARLWRPASGASPAPGCCPGPGSFAGAGHSSSSSDSGCSCDSPACSGGKQAGRSSSWLKTTKPDPMKEREKGSGPPSAEL